MKMQHVGQAARSSCLVGNWDELIVPVRDFWMCRHFSWVRKIAAIVPYRLDGDLHFTLCSWTAPCWLTHCCFPFDQNWKEAAGSVKLTCLDLWKTLQMWIYAQSIIKPLCECVICWLVKQKSCCSEFLCFQHSISPTTKLKQYHLYDCCSNQLLKDFSYSLLPSRRGSLKSWHSSV